MSGNSTKGGLLSQIFKRVGVKYVILHVGIMY